MDAQIEKITPEMAAEWLAHNTRNRPIKPRHLAALSQAIQRGDWVVNGETIIFADDGTLLDGQHRLAAVVDAQLPIESLVVRGLPKAAQVTMDTGVKRTLADVLSWCGERNAHLLAGALGYLYRHRIGQQMDTGGRARVTHQQALVLLEQNPGLRESMHIGQRTSAALRASPSMATFLHYVLSEIDADDADAFFDTLISGVGLQEGDPILVLRRLLEREISAYRKIPQPRIQAMWIKAWNAWREGRRDLKFLRFTPGGTTREPFPEPI
jgi:hypothetical protein